MYMKIYENDKNRIIALCDEDLIGKVLKEGDIEINLKEHAYFYKGEKVDEEKIKEELKNFTSINSIGNKSVGLLLRLGIVNESDVKEVAGIKHVQVYRIGVER